MNRPWNFFTRNYLNFLSRNSGKIILFTILITILFALSLPYLRVENISEKFGLKKDDPVRIINAVADSLFGSSDYLFLGIDDSKEINPDVLKVISEMSIRISSIPGVVEVYSLAAAEKIVWAPYFDKLVPQSRKLLPADLNKTDIPTLKTILKSSPLYLNNIISADFKKHNIIIKLLYRGNKVLHSDSLRSIESSIIKVCSDYKCKYEFHLAGMGLVDLRLTKIVQKDIGAFGPLSLIICVMILMLFFRNKVPVLLALSVAVICIIWSLGIVSISGTPMSVSLSSIIPLILVSSIAYSIHYLDHYFINYNENESEESARAGLMNNLFIPELLAGLTTAAGFFSLMTSSFEGIKEVGLFIGAGILVCIIIANVFLPAVLFRTGRKNKKKYNTHRNITPWLVEFTVRYRNYILGFFIILTVVSVYGMLKLRQDTNHLYYIREDEPIRKAFAFQENNFGGALNLDVIIYSKKENYKSTITDIEAFEQELKIFKGVRTVISASDILKIVEAGKPGRSDMGIEFNYKDKDFPPDILYAMSSAGPGKNLIVENDSGFIFKIMARVRTAGSSSLQDLLTKVSSLKTKYFRGDKVLITGAIPYLVKSNDYIINSQLSSFSTAFLFVFGAMFLITFSIRLGFMAMIPNILPLIFIIGIMGWLNIPLDISNVMIASIAMGIIVDDSIHFLYYFKRSGSTSTIERIKKSFDFAGSPIIITTAVISAGFLSMAFSDFIPTAQFGLLSALNIVIAFLSELVLTPVLLLYFYPQKDLNTL